MASTKKKHRRTSHGTQKAVKGLAAKLDLVEKAMLRKDFPDFGPGDTVRVHVKIKEGEKERIQAFEGVVIGRYGKGANKTFNVRKISHGVGVERVFMETSPKVAKVEIINEGKVRRAKLYYLRKLEGKAAKIERDVEASSQTSTEGAAKTSGK